MNLVQIVPHKAATAHDPTISNLRAANGLRRKNSAPAACATAIAVGNRSGREMTMPKFRLCACHCPELSISSKNPKAPEFKLQGIFTLRVSWVPR
jgi:hypothetical protein